MNKKNRDKKYQNKPDPIIPSENIDNNDEIVIDSQEEDEKYPEQPTNTTPIIEEDKKIITNDESEDSEPEIDTRKVGITDEKA